VTEAERFIDLQNISEISNKFVDFAFLTLPATKKKFLTYCNNVRTFMISYFEMAELVF